MSNAIEIQGLTKTFGSKTAVSNLDLVIPQGSLYGFIGPNGAGKTTTIRMIMSIIFPDSGRLSVLGKASAVESKDRIGYLPEERGLYRKMKVGPLIAYMARLKGVDASGLDGKVRAWLDRLGLADCYRKKCEELSKGMQQKVQFIASVVHEPDLIILDEPFSGLDPVNRKMLRELIQEQHGKGRTIIFSTHGMYEAEQLCTHLFMIHRGNKVLDGRLDDIWTRYDPRVVHVEGFDQEDPESLKLALLALPGVATVAMTKGGLDLRLAEGVDPPGVIAGATASVRARSVALLRPNLENIFIDLVGGDAAALRAEMDDLGAGEKQGQSPTGVEA